MQDTPLGMDWFLRVTPWCVVRPQEDRYLIYNRHTDELHLVGEAGFLVYSLCDGAHDVAEIIATATARMNAPHEEAAHSIRTCLGSLMARGLVEVEGGD